MAGRKAKPIDVLVGDGKSHLTKDQIEARKEAESRINFGTDKIERPTWLDAVGKKMWEQLVEELLNSNLMTNVDVYALAIACDAYSNYVKAAKSIKTEGQTIHYTNAIGATNEVQHPKVAIAQKYHQIFKSYLSEFGLSPAARARLALPKINDDTDEFAELFDD